MKLADLEVLRMPGSSTHLELISVEVQAAGEIQEDRLREVNGAWEIRIHRSIPRFVEGDNYAASFGEQWNCRQCPKIGIEGSNRPRICIILDDASQPTSFLRPAFVRVDLVIH